MTDLAAFVCRNIDISTYGNIDIWNYSSIYK